MKDHITFEIGELLDPTDPVARWVTILTLAWNDLAIANRRLLKGLKKDREPGENFREARNVAAIVWELSDFLRDAEGKEPAVAAFIAALPADSQTDYRNALAATDGSTGTWFKNKLRDARQKASHYPKIGRKELAKAMGKLASEEGKVVTGRRFIDLDAKFADDIAVNLFFASDPKKWREEFGDFATQLRELVLAYMRFLQQAVIAYLQQHQDAFVVHRSWRSRLGVWLRRLRPQR